MASRDREILCKLALCLGLSGWALPGCGPIEYVNQVTRHADDAVEAARAVEAEKRSPYWWTRAVEYLHQARVEAGDADFQAANRFGRLATEAANHARDEAIADAASPTPKPEPVAPKPAPRPAPKPRAKAKEIEKLAPAVDEGTP